LITVSVCNIFVALYFVSSAWSCAAIISFQFLLSDLLLLNLLMCRCTSFIVVNRKWFDILGEVISIVRLRNLTIPWPYEAYLGKLQSALCTLLRFCFKIPSTSIEPRFTGIQSILQRSLDMQGTERRVTQFGFTALVSKLSNCWTKPYGHMVFLNIL
jgi:hypothetical protein